MPQGWLSVFVGSLVGSSGGSYSWVCTDSPSGFLVSCIVLSGAGVGVMVWAGGAMVSICARGRVVSVWFVWPGAVRWEMVFIRCIASLCI